MIHHHLVVVPIPIPIKTIKEVGKVIKRKKGEKTKTTITIANTTVTNTIIATLSKNLSGGVDYDNRHNNSEATSKNKRRINRYYDDDDADGSSSSDSNSRRRKKSEKGNRKKEITKTKILARTDNEER